MSWQSRASIHPGLHVSVVLKEDQPTGRLTHGIVQDILTKSAYHPRGIKVRLTDGCVGRVQVIRDAVEVIEDDYGAEPEDLVVLIVQDENGCFVVDDYGIAGEEESQLGFTAPMKKGANSANASARMLFNETGVIQETRHLFGDRVGDFDVHVYHCFVERKSTGIARERWRTVDEVASMSQEQSLTPFSTLVFDRLCEEYELIVEEVA